MWRSLLALVSALGLVAGTIWYLECRPARAPRREARPRATFEPAPPQSRALQFRAYQKHELARRVIAERIPLREAVELFREANGEDGLALLDTVTQGRSLDEKLSRQVISFVAGIEANMAADGQLLSGPRSSDLLQREFDLRFAAGEVRTEPPSE